MRRLLILAAGFALVVAACGSDSDGDGDAAQGDGPERTVEVEMRDIAFDPETVAVQRGETVRFVFVNTGKLDHDAFIGDAAAQREHGQEMQESGNGHGGHGGGDEAVTVEPGERAELVHTFDEAGDVLIGCHQPGHYDAGMRLDLSVS